MPGQRLIQPGQGLSAKIAKLTDFEYRVFEQVKLASDDFGVMPYSPSLVRAQNLRLRDKKVPEKQVADALHQIVTVGLLAMFEHQGEEYVCAPAWQRGQTIKYPRITHLPKPPMDVLGCCEESTRFLFSIHPGGKKLPKRFTDDSGEIPESNENIPEALPKRSGVSEAITPANANADANANAHANADASGSRARVLEPRSFDRQHATHIFGFCDFKCLSDAKVQEFAKDLPGGWSDPENHQRVLDWAEGVRDSWGDREKKPFEWYLFWQDRWNERLGKSTAKTEGTKSALTRLVERRS